MIMVASGHNNCLINDGDGLTLVRVTVIVKMKVGENLCSSFRILASSLCTPKARDSAMEA